MIIGIIIRKKTRRMKKKKKNKSRFDFFFFKFIIFFYTQTHTIMNEKTPSFDLTSGAVNYK